MTDIASHDLVGIGFGPSHIGLATALHDHNECSEMPLRAHFVEKQPCFGWHRGMLIDDATMQVSFLKDLVTMRDPTSPHTFLAFLHERGRLVDFINYKTLFPLRTEFHDYLEWMAAKFEHQVTYGQTVRAVVPVLEHGEIVAVDVVSDGHEGSTTTRGRNLAIAAGLVPKVPDDVSMGPRVWHNLDLLHRAPALHDEDPRRFVVVGAGQSAAEVVAYLHGTFPAAEVCSVYSRYGYAPSDDTPFANRIFDPIAVDEYHRADDDVKRMLFDYHRNTNYSVVDAELIEDLYRREYREKVQGEVRLRMMNASRVVDVVDDEDGLDVTVEFLPDRTTRSLRTDYLVYATGYRPADASRLLGELGRHVERRSDGELVVDRDYSVRLTIPSAVSIYLQGGTEHTHGISSTLLSNIAVRSGEIVASLAANAARCVSPDRSELAAHA